MIDSFVGHKLPENIVACPDIVDAASDADVLIFVLPHQFIKRACQPLSKLWIVLFIYNYISNNEIKRKIFGAMSL